ncbi:hypothetical protein IAT40_004132 [Kwoniella sp. CBS 6097]
MSQTSSVAPPSLASLASRAQSLLPRWAAATGMNAERTERFISAANTLGDSSKCLLSNATDADELAFRAALANNYPSALGEKPSGLQGLPSGYSQGQLSEAGIKALKDFNGFMEDFGKDLENLDLDDPETMSLLNDTTDWALEALSLQCDPQSGSGNVSAHPGGTLSILSGVSSERDNLGADSSGSGSTGVRSNDRFCQSAIGGCSDVSRRTPTSMPQSDNANLSSGSATHSSCGSTLWSSDLGSSLISTSAIPAQ